MKFTVSKDGAERATIRVDFRADLSTVAEAVALWAWEDQTGDPERAARTVSKRQIDGIVRQRYALQGPPDHWTEYGGGDDTGYGYDDVRELANDRVRTLYGSSSDA